MMDLKNMLGFSLGKKEADESELLHEVQTLKLAKEKAEKRVTELETKLNAQRDAQAVVLVEKAVSLGLINQGLKALQLEALKKDFEAQSVVLSKLIAEKETASANDPMKKNEALKEVFLQKSKGEGVELSFDYLQKNDPVELKRIKAQEPERYAVLSKEYAGGKRSN